MRQHAGALRLFLIGGAAVLGLLTLAWTLGQGSSQAQDGTRTVSLASAGWHNFVWTGATGTAAETALSCIAGNFAIAYGWDGTAWQRYVPDQPGITTLTTVDKHDSLLVLITTTGVECKDMPVHAPSPTRDFDLQVGWNNFVWTGASGTDPVTALECIEGDYAIAYRWMGTSGGWERHIPDSPDPPRSNMTDLNQYDSLLVLITAAGVECEDMPVHAPPVTPVATLSPTPTPTPPGGDVFLYSRFVPPVVYSDGSSTTTLEVHTTGQGIEAVYLESGSLSFGQLYDDGSHGDHTAGDGVYTLNGIKYPGFTLGWDTFSAYTFDARIVRVGGFEERHVPATLGVVQPGLSYPVEQLDARTSATTHAMFIVDDAGEIFPGFPISEVLCGKTNFIPYEKVYAHFPDAFDFVLVMPSGNLYDPVEFARRENVPYFVLAKNEVQNIGLPIFDDTAKFGSSGRLRGAVYHSFGSPAIMEHELGHAWGINYGSSLGLVSTTSEGGVNLSHWDEASDINGLMQEFVFADDVVGRLVDNGDGTYRVVPQAPDAEAYAPLELYLMGLIPPEEVPPVHRLINPDYSDPNRVTAEQVETITIQQLMAAEGGPRIPDYTASPKTFTAAFIAVSDRPFTQAEYDFFSAIAQYLASKAAPKNYVAPFYAATGGRGTLETRLPSPAP